MPVFSRTSAARPRTVLRATSPYGSRTLIVETDKVTTAAYLQEGSSGETLGFCWVANHRAAPATLEPSRLNAGKVPLMPMAHTKHPKGRKALDPRLLEVVWFEEGDGVALLEADKPLCVIPGWSDIGRGMAGYSRDALGQTPFARSLDEAAPGLNPRIRQARNFWEWQRGQAGWAEFQQGVLGHLLNRLGPGGYWWSDVAGQLPRIGVSERPSTSGRPYTVLSTVGMSRQRMPAPYPETAAGAEDSGRSGTESRPDAAGGYAPGTGTSRRGTVPKLPPETKHQHGRVELALATTMPSQRAGTIFRWLGPLPWHEVNWLGPGHILRWYQAPEAFPLGAEWDGVILVNDPGGIVEPAVPGMSGFSFRDDPVRWLWVVPITSSEREYAQSQGPHALIRRLARRDGRWSTAGG